jgi:single-strand DNA-binding protein
MLNEVILQGRLTREPELKYTTNNVPILRGSVAVQRSWAPKGEERKTDFFDFTAWRNTAEFINKYFSKGQEILICGALQSGTYEDRHGNKRTSVSILVKDINFCGSKSEGSRGSSSGGYVEMEDDGEVPF